MNFSFNSIEFILFLIVFIFIYYLTKGFTRKLFLLLSNLIFYSLIAKFFLLVLIYYIIITYTFSKFVVNEDSKRSGFILSAGIILQLCPLIFFKYFNIFGDSLINISAFTDWNYGKEIIKYAIPVGLSFYSFKSISFLVEKRRKSLDGIDSLLNISLYLAYFPSVISGPIDKPQNLITQFDKNITFDYERVTDGLKIMLWGYFIKLVIADRLSLITNKIFPNLHQYSGLPLLLGVLFFTVQIYCDFAGYSYVAYGLSKLLGIDIINNFKRPYYSKSISEFWTRWHVSLSMWLRDYLFVPLTSFFVIIFSSLGYFNKHYKLKDVFIYTASTLITMSVCGIWHGANVTFLIWGVYLGSLLSLSVIFRKQRNTIRKLFKLKKNSFISNFFRYIITFFLISISWIFFRSDSVRDIIIIFRNIVTGWGNVLQGISSLGFNKYIIGLFGLTLKDYYAILIFIPVLFVVDYLQEKHDLFNLLKQKNIFIRWSLYYALILSVIFLGAFNSIQGFIYQQF